MADATDRTRVLLETDEDFVAYCRALAHAGVDGAPAFETAAVHDTSGNINRVRRVSGFDGQGKPSGSVVVKTVPEGGRLERYPDIFFPEDRLLYELEYFEVAAWAAETEPELAGWVPRLFHGNREDSILVMQDMGADALMRDALLHGRAECLGNLGNLGAQLGIFHRFTRENVMSEWLAENPSCRANFPFVLTHQFAEPDMLRGLWEGMDDTVAERPAVQKEFLEEFGDALLPVARDVVEQFVDDDEAVLAHGDFFPGNVFVGPDGFFTAIDSELCMLGGGWYDTGAMLAHLVMHGAALDGVVPLDAFLEGYLETADLEEPEAFCRSTFRLAGFEIVRRIIGAANVSFLVESKSMRALLRHAAQWILEEE